MSHLHHNCESCNVPAVKVEAQPRERRQSKGQPATMLACGCCCCCCCCLHTVGGLIGAAVTSKSKYNWETRETQPSVARYYWPIFAVCAVLAVIGVALSHGGPFSQAESFLAGGFVAMLGLPLVQLSASVVTLLVVVCTAHPADRKAYLWSLGKITLGTVAGTIAGLVIMALMCIPFMAK